MRSCKHVCGMAALLAMLSLVSCNVVKEIGQSMLNLSRCTFKLDSISDFRLAGISLSGKSSLDVTSAAKALTGFAKGELPASFVLNVAMQNPNTGAGGTSKSVATMTSFAWTLLIDSAQTIQGNIAQPVTIPGTGQQTIVPLGMSLDLVKFFKSRGYDKIVNLAFALGGVHGSASRVTLRAKPTINTDFGPITYPGEIDIVNTEFRGQ